MNNLRQVGVSGCTPSGWNLTLDPVFIVAPFALSTGIGAAVGWLFFKRPGRGALIGAGVGAAYAIYAMSPSQNTACAHGGTK